MAQEVKKHKPEVKMYPPDVKEMSIEERYDRACDFFEMDHMKATIPTSDRAR